MPPGCEQEGGQDIDALAQESSLYRLKILYKGNSQDFYHNMFIDLQTEEKSLYPPLNRKWLTPQPLGQIT